MYGGVLVWLDVKQGWLTYLVLSDGSRYAIVTFHAMLMGKQVAHPTDDGVCQGEIILLIGGRWFRLRGGW